MKIKKNAFTLIELLAVIVILAIIALIATPIILGIINDAKEEANKRSIDNYAKAVQNSIVKYQLNNNMNITGKFSPKKLENNKLSKTIITNKSSELKIEYDGDVICDTVIINKDGSIYISDCLVNGSKVDYSYGKRMYGVLSNEKNKKEFGGKFLNTGISRDKISSLTLHNKIEIPEGYQYSDCSMYGDESVMCWWGESEQYSNYYEMHIGSEGVIYAPEDCSYLFTQLGSSKWENTILELSNLDTSKVTDMSYMFSRVGYDNLVTLDLGERFDTSNVTNMSNMFSQTGYNSMINLELGDKFDTSNVMDMSSMFSSCEELASLDLGDKFNTSNVTSMEEMFSSTGYTSMKELDLGNKFDTSNVTDMSNMFFQTGYTKLINLDLGDKFDTSNVIYMVGMFYGTGHDSMKELDLGDKFDTSKVTQMDRMFEFAGANSMTELDLGDKFDTSNVTNMSQMFRYTGYSSMISLDLGDKFRTTEKTRDVSNMFEGTGQESMTELNLGKFGKSFYTYASKSNMFTNCGTEGVLTKVIVEDESYKTWLESETSVPEFWLNNNIIQIDN